MAGVACGHTVNNSVRKDYLTQCCRGTIFGYVTTILVHDYVNIFFFLRMFCLRVRNTAGLHYTNKNKDL